MRPGSRTLEAPRGNRYAPARGMRLMMMFQWAALHVSPVYLTVSLFRTGSQGAKTYLEDLRQVI